MKIKVLVIDNNLDNYKRIKYNLQDEKIDVCYVLGAIEGIQRLATESWHLVIMSLLISEMNGTELLKKLRMLKSMPILLLSTPETEEEALEALRYGADGVMGDGDSLDMWLAQAQATLRRYLSANHHAEPSYIAVCNGNIIIDTEKRKVFNFGVEIELTRKEYELIAKFAESPRRVITYEQVYSDVWNEVWTEDHNSIRCQISRLRKKLNQPDLIQSVHDVGYRLEK